MPKVESLPKWAQEQLQWHERQQENLENKIANLRRTNEVQSGDYQSLLNLIERIRPDLWDRINLGEHPDTLP